MIGLYDQTTPNGDKPTMFLEDAGLPCNLIPVTISDAATIKGR